MANTPTANFAYNKPAEGDLDWDTTLNGNFDLIDADLIVEHNSDGTHKTATITSAGGLLASGTVIGATSQAQDFGSNGVKADVVAESGVGNGVTIDGVLVKDNAITASGGIIAPTLKPASDSTTAVKISNAAGTAIVTVDTTNGRLGLGKTPSNTMEIYVPSGNNFLQIETGAAFISGVEMKNSVGAWRSMISSAGFYGISEVGGNWPFRIFQGAGFDTLVLAANGSVGINATTPAAKLHIHQEETAGAMPVLTLDQADVSEEFIRLIGTSASDDSQSFVDAADRPTPGTLTGWIKIYVQDKAASGAITDGVYYVPFYTAPTA